ncbi:hypothetical protein RJ640_017851 [Escallonia rubra]|uniref:Uncharacterized protein n=1 Tax=Escallonia rubra TaxID=112253 RepID=A0AA88RQN2_9ASTE|nr:hypothetical protein RJ640_017851 [Escallonia rubra]
MGYIGAHGVAALHRHKYSGVDNSYLAKYVLQPFWSRCVTFFPLWMPETAHGKQVLGLSGCMDLDMCDRGGLESGLCGLGFSPPRLLRDEGEVELSKRGDFLVRSFASFKEESEGVDRFRIILISFPSNFRLHLLDSCSWSSLHCLDIILCILLFEYWFQIYSPHLDSPPPRWVNFAHGLLLFLYQTFDAVDGKQARRTDSTSPLGELFDHGCDALGCALEALAFGSTAVCGRSTFWFWVISAIPFYGATWEHYFTNILILPAINGPTEGLMLIYVVHFITALIGAECWVRQFGKSLPFLSWVPYISEIPTYGAVLFLMTVFAVIPTVSCNVYNVYKVVQARKGSMLSALAMLYPFAVLLIGVVVWDYLSPYDLRGNYPHLIVVGTGLAFGFLVGRMILARLCDEPKGLKTNMCMCKPVWDPVSLMMKLKLLNLLSAFEDRKNVRKSLLYLPFAIANALTARLNDGIPLVDERWVLLGYCMYTAALYLHFATSIIHEITTALGIYCFR